jgi:hypothetical protein
VLLTALAVGGVSLGLVDGQQREWRDWTAYALIAGGLAAMAALPLQLLKSRHPLVPPSLFRSRNFTVTNVSTLLIYGALYVSAYYLPLFTQGVLGYTAAAAGVAFLPASLLLALLSARFGGLGERLGPRLFMTAGPLLMALGLAWLLRIGPESEPWRLQLDRAATYLPPASYLLDLLPAALLFGFGVAMLVAPLTTVLMTSVPTANSGVASAVNNAISRVGPQLAGALVFVAVTRVFYESLARRLGADPASPALRAAASPLNHSAAHAGAAQAASTEAFHVAMAVGVLLLVLGAAVNWVGIRPSERGSAGGAARM